MDSLSSHITAIPHVDGVRDGRGGSRRHVRAREREPLREPLIKGAACMAANAYLVADPVPEDFTRARIVVHVNWQTVRDPANGQETRFWHTPVHCSVTRRDYRDNPDVLFEEHIWIVTAENRSHVPGRE